MNKAPLKVGGFIFFLVALGHLSRLIWKFDITIAQTFVPMWANGVGFVVAGGLAFWLFKSAKN